MRAKKRLLSFVLLDLGRGRSTAVQHLPQKQDTMGYNREEGWPFSPFLSILSVQCPCTVPM